jgi:hypothetical protein
LNAAVLEPWVNAPVLSDVPLTRSICRRAGRLLGVVGARADKKGRAAIRSGSQRIPALESDICYLVDKNAIRLEDGKRLLAQAVKQAPNQIEYGFVHGDICPENLVLVEGRPYSIDNGLVKFDALDLDLARTPMSSPERTAFVSGYQAHRSAASYHDHKAYWKIEVLCRAAAFQHQWNSSDAAPTLKRLSDFTPQPQRSVNAPPSNRRLAAKSMETCGLEYAGCVIRVETDDATALEWLREFVLPAFSEVRAEPYEWRVRLNVDGLRFASHLTNGPRRDQLQHINCFTLDGAFQQLPAWNESLSERTLFDERNHCFYTINTDRSTIDILASPKGRKYRLGLMRVIRELATIASMDSGRLPIHGSVVDLAGQGILFTGPKRAGKTSLLIHAVHSAGGRFVTNDRAMAAQSPSGPVVHGMPTIVKIRADSLQRFPWLKKQYRLTPFRRNDTISESRPWATDLPPSLSSAQFCRLLSCDPARSAPLTAIVFPTIVDHVANLDVVSIPPREAATLLFESLLLPGESPRVADAFARGKSAPAVEIHNLRQACRQLTSQVPAYRCRLGSRAYEQPFELLGARKGAA